MRRRTAVLLACLGLLVLPASSQAAFDFGSNLAESASGSNGCSMANCTQWNSVLHPASTAGTLTSPITGVVVSFTLKKDTASAAWTPFHLRAIEPTGGAFWKGLGASSPDVVPTMSPGLETFPVRLPIAAGDYVGIEQSQTSGPSSAFAVAFSVFGAGETYATPRLPDNGSPASTSTFNQELLLRARVEPDADRDGFGDETQDACPSNPATHGACPVKKKKCKKKHKRRAADAKKKKCKKRKHH